MTTEHRDLHVLRATGAPRTETINGKQHLIVPCVALMETVIHAVNSDIPEMVPLDTLKTAAKTWDGKPVLLGHPTKDGKQIPANTPGVFESYGLGKIKNPRIEGTKLLMDACLDPDLVEKLGGSKFLTGIKDGSEHIELSVGAYVHAEDGEGEFGGKKYKATWRATTGDHLALLPNSRGACSVAAGCGTHRAAQRFVAAEEFRMATEAEIKALMPHQKMAECPSCMGTGQIAPGKDCPTCDGEGDLPVLKANRDISQKQRDKMPDSEFAGRGESFPINEPEDVMAAVHSIGQAGPNNYSSEQLKTNIIRIAYRRGKKFINELPDDWKKEIKAAEEFVGLLGKRNSQKDVAIIQGVHDHAVSLGASCDRGNTDPKLSGMEGIRYAAASLSGQSLDQRMRAVTDAVYQKYNQNAVAPVPASDYGYPREVYDDHVIVSKGDKLYSVDYTVAKDGTVSLGKSTEVKQQYVAAAAPPATIVLEGGQWTLYSKDKLRRLGQHKTREEAEAHEQAIARSLARQKVECGCGGHS
jgi:hypothetical protein